MNIFEILKNMYTNRSSKWINILDDNMISPFIINNWLSMNGQLGKIVVYLDQFIFSLKPKHWLHLAWSVVPKQSKTPFIKYLKKEKHEEQYKELHEKIISKLKINDLDEYYKRIIFSKDQELLETLMRDYGMPRKLWLKYGLNPEGLRYEEEKRVIKKGLDLWEL